MDAQLERPEIEPVRAHDHDFAVEHHRPGQQPRQLLFEVREVAAQRLQVARLQVQLRAIEEQDAAEPVPLRLVQPALALGDGRAELGKHGRDGGLEGEWHRQIVPRTVARRLG